MTRYLHGHAASALASHATRTAENSCGCLLPELRPGMRLLDIGSGPGTITCDLAERVGGSGLVVGVDPAADAVVAGRAEAARRGDGRWRELHLGTYATGELTAWWGGSWAVRVLESRFAEEALGLGLADRAELEAISAAWREWGAHPDAVFVIAHGELLARV